MAQIGGGFFQFGRRKLIVSSRARINRMENYTQAGFSGNRFVNIRIELGETSRLGEIAKTQADDYLYYYVRFDNLGGKIASPATADSQ